ncbi:probable transcription factor At5g28040 [Neltuma alba]|uniref:probable transcription factor At5g28040 n=1 Tax=Neltuma alba TaxID=207710 RepID=UPI0010A4EEE6|nr:probable transcription factor At5g28040 [Prosopis alba]XP_028784354.1 probable transcription factor At5g28040 [Prosopis alba]
MLSPLVSWILASSPSSSSSSEEEDNFVDDEDHYENVGENEHFLREAEELPSTSCAGDTKSTPVALAAPGADDSYIPNTDTGSRKRRRISHSYPRRQYQRLWTKQDEIELLRGYLGYVKQNRWATTSLQNDVTFFYDHIRPKLNKDFNKNQVVQKLRVLKRKHQTVLDKINSGREVSHKNPQEEAIFEISQKIWGKNQDEESSPEPDTDNIEVHSEEDDGDESGRLNGENRDVKKLIEETMRSCLSPLNNNNAAEGSGLKLVQQYGSGGEGDEEERKQKILELEAYLKQLELLQDQIKARIEELRNEGE